MDTSALVATLSGESERDHFNAIIASRDCLLSAGSYLEAFIVIETRFGEEGARLLSLYLHESGMTVVPVDRAQADLARRAYRRFGKGRHPAALNYGDCFAYALAVARGAPLLFKGDDFARTDLEAA